MIHLSFCTHTQTSKLTGNKLIIAITQCMSYQIQKNLDAEKKIYWEFSTNICDDLHKICLNLKCFE